MDVSIIIPVYKRFEWIDKCIGKLVTQDFKGSFEVIIVDDGSPDDTEIRSAVRQFTDRKDAPVRFIKNIHAGPAATRNYGAGLSSGYILCFVDDDSIAETNWLTEITKPFENSVKVGMVSGKTCSYNREASLPILLEKTVYAGKSWATCNIAYRRTVFEELDGFDESFPDPSWEDNDLGLRALWAGHVQLYNDKAIVFHPHENSIDEYKKKCLLNGRGAARFSRKYLFRKPIWGLGTPLVMSRRLIYGLLPSVWRKKVDSEAYVKFLWSFYSLLGFIQAIKEKTYGNN